MRDVLILAAILFPVGLFVSWLIVKLGWVRGMEHQRFLTTDQIQDQNDYGFVECPLCHKWIYGLISSAIPEHVCKPPTTYPGPSG